MAAAIIAALGGCASYRASPLPSRPDLATSLAGLDLTVPSVDGRFPVRKIYIGQAMTLDEVGVLAILNNPDLKAERGTIGVARADLLQATLLPNPSVNFQYGVLLGGPGTTNSVFASLSQDIAAIIARGARVGAAEAHLGQVDADQLWREWQIAQKARQLAVDLYWDGEAIRLVSSERKLIASEMAEVRRAIAAGNMTLTALAPLLTAAAAAEQSLGILRLGQLKNWQALDALLGLVPQTRFSIAQPTFPALPSDPEPLIAVLPEQRPDLAALRLGYLSAEEDVRAAILGQFPASSIGPFYGSDTSKVVSAGPNLTFTLPIFDQNQGNIAKSRATRLLLREQFQARLDAAVANVQALFAQLRGLEADLGPARKAAAAAASLVRTARTAYAQGNFDLRSLTDYETTALERSVQVTAIKRQIGEDRIMIAVELGLDLPHMRIALSGTEAR